MNVSKAVLYSVQWQKLRVSLLGNFNHEEGVKVNICKISNYIQETILDEIETARRLWRAINLLNAVRMGYHGQGLVGTMMDKHIISYRDKLQALRKNYSDLGQWDWNDVERDLYFLKALDTNTYNKIYNNLQSRVKMAHYKVGTMDNRSELAKFLSYFDK